MNKITVLLADDHQLLRDTLGCVIDSDPRFQVIASCGDSQDAVDIVKKELPDIVLMDINMAPFSGIEATRQIKLLCSPCHIVGMSVHADPGYAKKMIKAGASGYVTKNSSKDEILHAMIRVRQGEIYLCKEIKNILGEQLTDDRPQAGINLLTERELQIVHFIKKGRSSKEIALDINVAAKTVEVHRHNILQKLKLRNTASLVNFMYKHAAYLI